MELIATREFRTKPGSVWKKLRQSGRIVITSNGKPVAIMKDITDSDLEDEWKTELIADGIAALTRLRKQAQMDKLNKLQAKEIDAEIRASRKAR